MSSTPDTIAVVAAVIQDRNHVMVAQRGTGSLAGKWEFPGGKVRTGESHTEALQREIMEEFSVAIEVGDRIEAVPFSVGDTPYRLTAFFARHTSGAYRLQEHTGMQWVLPEELPTIDLSPADVPIANTVIRLLTGLD